MIDFDSLMIILGYLSFLSFTNLIMDLLTLFSFIKIGCY